MCLVYYTMCGMMVVARTPGIEVAAIVLSFFLSFWNLFSDFLSPRPQIPIWWRWYYWGSPVAWTIYGLVASQVGDVDTALEVRGAVNVKVKGYLKKTMGFDRDLLPVVVAAHVGWLGSTLFRCLCIWYRILQILQRR